MEHKEFLQALDAVDGMISGQASKLAQVIEGRGDLDDFSLLIRRSQYRTLPLFRVMFRLDVHAYPHHNPYYTRGYHKQVGVASGGKRATRKSGFLSVSSIHNQR